MTVSSNFPKHLTREWTEEEIELVKEFYGELGTREIAKALGRTQDAIQKLAKKLKLKRSVVQIQKDLAKKIERVKAQRSSLKPSLKPVGGYVWTEEEDAFLREKYPTTETKALAKALGRTLPAIRKRVTYLKLRKDQAWVRNERRKDAARARNAKAIRLQARAHAAHRDGASKKAARGTVWTEEEDAFLREKYPTTDTGALAKALGRTPGAVRVRAGGLGITKDRVFKSKALQKTVNNARGKRVPKIKGSERKTPEIEVLAPNVIKVGNKILVSTSEITITDI